jgi:hypothetical protein
LTPASSLALKPAGSKPAKATTIAHPRASNKTKSGVTVLVALLVTYSAAGWSAVAAAVLAICRAA